MGPFRYVRIAISDTVFTAMYWYYQVMVCLLKFDFFAFTGVTMQVCVLLAFDHHVLNQLYCLAANCRAARKIYRVSADNCRYPCCFDSTSILRYSAEARNQMVCAICRRCLAVMSLIPLLGLWSFLLC